ncbi:hypothetical protein [Jongsikchunia kroppenstedtii]|uniref:hypothetical protein n=1 Tax=Jongsikchunia kroppenstedtii TaxID=1121721 RepID=UPI00035FF81C|nr:hypothetical protein [Jongsikchunia kroppenstedtii]
MTDEGSTETTNDAVAERIAAAVAAVPGVAGLHGGQFGEIGTYLPGRRVAGVRLTADRCEVHISVQMHTDPDIDGPASAGESVLDMADRIRRTASAIVDLPVDVVIEDLTIQEDPPARTGETHE